MRSRISNALSIVIPERFCRGSRERTLACADACSQTKQSQQLGFPTKAFGNDGVWGIAKKMIYRCATNGARQQLKVIAQGKQPTIATKFTKLAISIATLLRSTIPQA
jgi:hypothetical protein